MSNKILSNGLCLTLFLRDLGVNQFSGTLPASLCVPVNTVFLYVVWHGPCFVLAGRFLLLTALFQGLGPEHVLRHHPWMLLDARESPAIVRRASCLIVPASANFLLYRSLNANQITGASTTLNPVLSISAIKFVYLQNNNLYGILSASQMNNNQLAMGRIVNVTGNVFVCPNPAWCTAVGLCATCSMCLSEQGLEASKLTFRFHSRQADSPGRSDHHDRHRRGSWIELGHEQGPLQHCCIVSNDCVR